jgi:hypothetical protein
MLQDLHVGVLSLEIHFDQDALERSEKNIEYRH